MPDWTIQSLLAATQTFLSKKGADNPRLLSEILLAHVLKKDRVYLFSHFDEPIGQELRTRYREVILRAAKGEPFAYITGEKEFMSLSFKVTPATLIPRPDTEILVETALQLIEKHGYRRIVDVGTGSGCIPISIAHYAKTPLQITATDLSPEALAVARENAQIHQAAIELRQGNLLNVLRPDEKQQIDLITANLPYIPLPVYEKLERTVKDFEPRTALTDEQDGLSLYRRLIRQARTFLKPTGRMLLEIDPRQAGQLQFIREAGFDFQILPDLAGRARAVVVKPGGLPDDIPQPPVTQHLIIHPEKPDLAILAKAASILNRGGLVAFPTETVYGLGAAYNNPAALQEIFHVKGRPQESPLLVAIADVAQLAAITPEIPEAAQTLLETFWPGPLSIIFPARKELAAALQNDSHGVGVRMPENRVAQELIRLSGPITAPSANPHGRPSPTEGIHVLADLNGKIPAILDAGRTTGGVESTIIDCTVQPPHLVRSGAIPQEAIEAVLGYTITASRRETPAYQLGFQVMPCETADILQRKKEILQRFDRPYGILSFDQPDVDPQAVFTVCFTPESHPADWFTLLRQAEKSGIHTLLTHPFAPVKDRFPEGLRQRIERILK